jgi:hypothetical protein
MKALKAIINASLITKPSRLDDFVSVLAEAHGAETINCEDENVNRVRCAGYPEI